MDSDMTALAEAVFGGPPQPYIVVYTDSDDRPRVVGAELYDGDLRVLNIVLEIGVANAIKGSSGNLTIEFAATDPSMELACDIVETQATAALWGDPYSQWGELLKKMCYRIIRVPSRRGGQAQGGVRFAARRVTYVVNTIYDVLPGQVLDDTHALKQFITMAKGNPIFGINDVGQIIEDVLATSATAYPNWRLAQGALGMQTDAIKALQVPGVPLPLAIGEEPPLDTSDTSDLVPVITDIELADLPPPDDTAP